MRSSHLLSSLRQCRWLRGTTVASLMLSLGFPLPPIPTGAEESPPWESLDDDGDGWSNGDESWVHFTDPYDAASYPGAPPTTPTWESMDDDGDGWSNGDESWVHFTNPYDSTSYPGSAPTNPTWETLDDDGDGWSNGDESWIYYTDPNNPASYPGYVDPGSPSAGGVWLVDLDGDGLDDALGFWIGGYSGPLASQFVPGSVTPGFGTPPNPFGNFISPYASAWPDGGPDADGDGLSDAFESANSWEETVSQTTSWTDESGVEHHGTESVNVLRGLRWDAADSDGDGLPDGYELLTLTPLMEAAGRSRYDPTATASRPSRKSWSGGPIRWRGIPTATGSMTMMRSRCGFPIPSTPPIRVRCRARATRVA